MEGMRTVFTVHNDIHTVQLISYEQTFFIIALSVSLFIVFMLFLLLDIGDVNFSVPSY